MRRLLMEAGVGVPAGGEPDDTVVGAFLLGVEDQTKKGG